MDFGIGYFPTHDAVGPGAIALLAEERGFVSLFFAEHTHIPASSRDTGGGELPHMYFHTYDLFVALTAAAAARERQGNRHVHVEEPQNSLSARWPCSTG